MLIRRGARGDLPALREIESAAGRAFATLGMHAVADDEPPSLGLLESYRRVGKLWVAAEEERRGWFSRVTSAPCLRSARASRSARSFRSGPSLPADGRGRPVAYVLLESVDGSVHIEQISVHPRYAHRRIGRALIEHVAAGASAEGVPALTLATFADVPWNAPYYERCGFRRLAVEELTPGLRDIRAREDAAGLDRWPRVCMRRPLAA